MGYCSSDAWVGNVGANYNAVGWPFRGQRILEATLATLVANFSLGVATVGAPRMLLAGGYDAGARGAMYWADYVPALLPAGTQLRALFDGPLWMSIEPLNPETPPLLNQTLAAVYLQNSTGRAGPACVANYNGVDLYRCFFGALRLPLVRTQYMVSAPQFDPYQLSYEIGAPPPYGGTQLAYANIFQRNMRSLVMTLPAAQQGGSMVFSSACYTHGSTLSEEFGAVRVDGSISLKDYLNDW